jgi:hypothetical protein
MAPFGGVSAERFFAHHHLPAGRRRWRFGMRVVRAGDIDQIDIGRFDDAAPIGLYRLISPFGGEILGAFGVSGADGFEDGLVGYVEKVVDLGEGVRVGPAHEPVTDHSDVELFHVSSSRGRHALQSSRGARPPRSSG